MKSKLLLVDSSPANIVVKVALLAVCIGLMLMITLQLETTVSAHPGNTASDGAHYCWTNCEYWGYEYGTRHSHGGYSQPTYNYSYQPSDTEQGRTNGIKHAEEVNRAYIVETAELDGYDAGYVAGKINEYEKSYFFITDSEPCTAEIKYSGPVTASYKSSFQSHYEDACQEVYNDTYEVSYQEGYDEGKTQYDIEEEERAAQESAQNSSVFWWIVGAGALIWGGVWFSKL